jgi:[protein-PII] uridylyltransferase
LEAAQRRRPKILGGFAWLRRNLEGFVVEGGRLNVPDPAMFAAEPIRMLRLFRLAQRHNHDIPPAARHLVPRPLYLIHRLVKPPAPQRRFSGDVEGAGGSGNDTAPAQ